MARFWFGESKVKTATGPHSRQSPRLVRSLRLLVGLYLFGLGTGLAVLSALGVSPWDVLHDGIRIHTRLSFGQAAILVSVVLTIAGAVFRVKIGFGTIANAILIGLFVDLTLYMGDSWGIDSMQVTLRFAVTIGGILLVGLGSALYIGAEMGVGPRDSLMVLIGVRTPLGIGWSRTLVEGSALFCGALLGGAFGVGTVLFALTIGPAVQMFFRLLRLDETGATRHHQSR